MSLEPRDVFLTVTAAPIYAELLRANKPQMNGLSRPDREEFLDRLAIEAANEAVRLWRASDKTARSLEQES